MDSAILLYINNENEKQMLNLYRKIKSTAKIEQLRYAGMEPQAATGSSMELTLGWNPISRRRALLTRALKMRAPGRSWLSQITGGNPKSSHKALES